MRPEVLEFISVAPLPFESAEPAEIARAETLLDAITAPVSDEEAELLVQCFGEDECFGLAWSLVHLVETAPTFEVTEPPEEGDHLWMTVLYQRVLNARAQIRN